MVDSGHVAASASGRARIIVLLVWLPQPKGLCHKSLAAGPIPNLAPQATVLGSLGRMYLDKDLNDNTRVRPAGHLFYSFTSFEFRNKSHDKSVVK